VSRSRLVGLIPAAGSATRLAPLPCSKELWPVGFQRNPEGEPRPKPVSQYLLEKMERAGATEVFVILRSGKWDIADYYGDGSRLGLRLAYLVMGDPYGPPFTLAQAAPFVTDATALFGFADILFQPEDGFARALQRLETTGADLVLALCPIPRTVATDVVEIDAAGRVVGLEPKENRPRRTDHDATYLLAVWRPAFTEFLSTEVRRLAAIARARAGDGTPEWPMGAVIAAALRAGLHVDSVRFEEGRFLDIGTPHGLIAAAEFPGVWGGTD
jgi:glucose-1-phosphate thymidylyltransferase